MDETAFKLLIVIENIVSRSLNRNGRIVATREKSHRSDSLECGGVGVCKHI
jgi:hypothetical protein